MFFISQDLTKLGYELLQMLRKIKKKTKLIGFVSHVVSPLVAESAFYYIYARITIITHDRDGQSRSRSPTATLKRLSSDVFDSLRT